MRKLVLIILLSSRFFVFGQDKSSSEVNYLNYDVFFATDSLTGSPVLPTLGSSYSVGYQFPWFHKKEKNRGNYIGIFPVFNALGGFHSQADVFSSKLGAGVGIVTQLSPKFYARILLTGNYYYQNEISPQYYRIFNSNLWEYSPKNNSVLGIQPRIRLSYSPYSFLNIQVGIDQQFIGFGKRSVLLSDFSAPYPFVQLRTKIWKIEVTNLYQFFKEYQNGKKIRKFGSTHFFNFKASNNFQIGLFESVVFASKDTLMNRGYDIAYLNPFLFYRPTEYGLGSQDRILIGLNTSYRINNWMIYGQFVFDEFILDQLVNRTRWWGNKYAGQIGFKHKMERKDVQFKWLAELNFARPFVYTHNAISTVYGNQGNPLAHPSGANFVEVYSHHSIDFPSGWKLSTQFFFIQQGGRNGNDTSSFGADIYKSYDARPYDYGFKIGGNGKVNRYNFSVEASYRISKKLRLDLFIRPGMEVNNLHSSAYYTRFYVFGGLRTDLWREKSFNF